MSGESECYCVCVEKRTLNLKQEVAADHPVMDFLSPWLLLIVLCSPVVAVNPKIRRSDTVTQQRRAAFSGDELTNNILFAQFSTTLLQPSSAPVGNVHPNRTGRGCPAIGHCLSQVLPLTTVCKTSYRSQLPKDKLCYCGSTCSDILPCNIHFSFNLNLISFFSLTRQ